MAVNLSAYFQWAVQKCADSNVGYSQTYREQQTIDGITYYDCSSFIWYALQAGGFNLTAPPFTTDAMLPVLQAAGFVPVNINGTWAAGDIVWRTGHCEIVYSGGTAQGVTMGAHTDSVPLADQVSINSTPSTSASYTYLYRYAGGSARQWIRGTHSQYFNTEQMQNNALCMRDWFQANTDWSLPALAGMAANMQGESTLNPDSMENPSLPIGTVNADGIGLVQWTTSPGMSQNPLFDILIYLFGSVGDWGEPEKQCAAIVAEYQYCMGIIHTQDFEAYWRTNSTYPLSFDQWAHSTGDPAYLAMHFEFSYERPLNTHPERGPWGTTWYNYFLNNPYVPPTPGGSRQKMKLWMMLRRWY